MGLASGKKPILDPGFRVKKAPDPGSGSATLVYRYLGGHCCQMKDGLSAPICRLHIEAGGHELLHGLHVAVEGGGVGGRVAGRVARPYIGPQLQQGRHHRETAYNRRCVDERRNRPTEKKTKL